MTQPAMSTKMPEGFAPRNHQSLPRGNSAEVEPNFGSSDAYTITAIFWEITGIFIFAFVMYGSIAILVSMG
jgi:hypothetical protein